MSTAELFFKRQPTTAEINHMIDGFASWIEVDLDAVGWNVDQVMKRTGGEIIPCIKGNAYGHGATPIAAYMMHKGVKRFLVAKLYEATQIRDAGLDCGVVSLDPLFGDEQYATVVSRGITQTVYRIETAEKLSRVAQELGKTATVWVKIDTGLGRVGVRWSDAVSLIKRIHALTGVEIQGLFSTLSETDELDKIQIERMKAICAELDVSGVPYGVVSMASSNSVFHRPFTWLKATRPGLMLFGFYPDPEDRAAGITLKQAFAFKARLEQVKWVEAGESLTYSRRFTAKERTMVGTAHIGYSDGYPRGLTQKGLVRVGDVIKPVLGTVSVNHILIDVTETKAEAGSVIEAIGREGENDAHKVCEKSGIMTYSLMVGLNQNTPRVYYEGGIPVAVSVPSIC